MPSCQTTWEDEENNRHVELAIEYQLDRGRIAISQVTPTRVHFFHSGSSQRAGSLGVWTEAGRRMLARRAREAGHLDRLLQDIADGAIVELPHGHVKPVREASVSTIVA
jgi:hypothetical protein